ncbi:MAG TPA: trypsin-like peptidase domain-containing protein [Casimicrobiaceae bacterium]|nr:trypsin-like peptidase domain-containing protein [Casimicrobiaceae bacterium]
MTSSIPRAQARRLLAAVAIGVALPALAADPITAVPPAEYHPNVVEKAAPAQLLLPAAAPGLRIALPAPTDAERALLKARNAATGGGAKTSNLKGPLALAFPRDVPASSASIPLAALQWQALADGSRAAKIQVTSPGALALRVALALPAVDTGIDVRFAGNGERASVFGPIPANTIASDAQRFGVFWSPVLDGDTATIELHAEAGASVPSVPLSIARVSHQVVAPATLDKLDSKAVEDIGTSAACEIDVACVTQTDALASSKRAVAAIEFTQEDGYTYLCTGQLLNDSVASNTPYFFSAQHCLDSAMAARTLNEYWFFDAVACGSKAVPPYVQQSAGATMLARSPDFDWSLVRLNAAPPPGVTFSAWRIDPIPSQTAVTVLHHPEGDLKKWSEGATQGYQVYTDGSSFAQVIYGQGSTEPGSSGAGLLTFNNAGYYELRGGLWRGSASCGNPGGTDEYSRIDGMLKLTRQYLTPGSPGTPNTAVAVEYYNAALDHYFITISPAEISDLDSGVHPGWERTGLRFLAYQTQVAGTNPVCRFYRTPGFGDSHFYSASPSECQNVIDHPDLYPGWTYESGNVFYIALPDPTTGACANATQPVWRFFNQRTTNHRYVIDHTTRDEMRADPATWIPEGYGPDNVIMCAPIGS